MVLYNFSNLLVYRNKKTDNLIKNINKTENILTDEKISANIKSTNKTERIQLKRQITSERVINKSY